MTALNSTENKLFPFSYFLNAVLKYAYIKVPSISYLNRRNYHILDFLFGKFISVTSKQNSSVVLTALMATLMTGEKIKL